MFSLKSRVSIIAAFVALAAFAPVSDGLTIVSRKQWGAKPPKSAPQRLPRVPTGLVVIHHGASAPCFTKASCTNVVRSYQNHHMNGNKWADIGYNFIVGEDGNVYEGRGWNVVGAHAPGANSKSVGICMIGNFQNKVPNALAIKAVQELIQYGVKNRVIASNYKLTGHRQVTQTDCPGNSLFNLLKKWPHFTPKP